MRRRVLWCELHEATVMPAKSAAAARLRNQEHEPQQHPGRGTHQQDAHQHLPCRGRLILRVRTPLLAT